MEALHTSRRVCNPADLLDMNGSDSRLKRGREEEDDFAPDPLYSPETEHPPKRRLLSVFVDVASRFFSWVSGSNASPNLAHDQKTAPQDPSPETTDGEVPDALDISPTMEEENIFFVEDGKRQKDLFDHLSPILVSESKPISNGLVYNTDLSPKFETTLIYSESDEEFSERSISIDELKNAVLEEDGFPCRSDIGTTSQNKPLINSHLRPTRSRSPLNDPTQPILIDDSDDDVPESSLQSPFVRSTYRRRPGSVRRALARNSARKSRKSPLFEDRRRKHVKTITREMLQACVPFSQAKELGYLGNEREYAVFTDYAKQVYEASIGAKPQSLPAKQKSNAIQSSPMKNLPSRLDSWGEEEWLKSLRERIEKAHLFKPPEDRPFTPTFDRLKQQDLLMDQLIDEQRKKAQPKRNNFPELSEEAYETIEWALSPDAEEIVEGFNVTLCRSDIETLRDGRWLNDEIMNFYGNLIMERAKKSQSSYPEIHVFNTFFYSTLRDKGYQKVRRWSRKFNIFKKDYIIIPVHLGMHWVCAIINFKQKRIEYYDSMHGNNPQCFQLLRHYLEEESMDKLSQPMDLSEWTDYAPKNIPSQQNGFDCGVFTCMFAEYISRNEPFDFHQKHMKYIRQRMIWEIIQKHLVNQ